MTVRRLAAALAPLVIIAAPLRGKLPFKPQLTLLGDYKLESGLQFDSTTVGGLSGIGYDPTSGTYYAISDDRSQVNPARIYTLEADYDRGGFHSVTLKQVITLLDSSGGPFAAMALDPESVRYSADSETLFWTSEGDANAGIPAAVNVSTPAGKFARSLDVPDSYLPKAGESGIRSNLAFESLTFSPNGRYLYTAVENALVQDGPIATPGHGSRSRVLAFDVNTGQPTAEYIYQVAEVVAAPQPADAFCVNGIVEMLAVDPYRFIVLERSFSVGVGHNVRLYLYDISCATNVLNKQLDGSEVPGTKRLVLDLDELGVPIENVEGITWGPVLADGTKTLLLVSDNNFDSDTATYFIALAVE